MLMATFFFLLLILRISSKHSSIFCIIKESFRVTAVVVFEEKIVFPTIMVSFTSRNDHSFD